MRAKVRRRCALALSSTLPSLSLTMLLALAAPDVRSAEGYHAVLIADPLSGFGLPSQGWATGIMTSLNNLGTVVYSASAGTFPNEFRTGIFASDGVTMRTIAQGLRVGTGPGEMLEGGAINNAGQVLFGVTTGFYGGSAARLWDDGQVSTFLAFNPAQNFSPSSLSANGQLSDARTVAASSGSQLFALGAGGNGPAVATGHVLGPSGSLGISSSGAYVVSRGFGYSPGNPVGLLVSQRGEVILGSESNASTPRPLTARVNDNGIAAFTSFRTGGGSGGNLLGIVDARAPAAGAYTLLDTSSGLDNFGAGQAGLAISNKNEIVFAAGPAASAGSGLANVYATTTAGGAPRPVLLAGDAVGTDGTTFAGVLNASQNSFQINDRGQVSLYARLQRGNVSFDGIVRVDPEAGVSPGNPLLPVTGSPPAAPPLGGLPPLATPVIVLPGWSVPGCRRMVGGTCFVDPEFAAGYVYTMSAGGPKFESVLVPAALSGGDAEFTLHFDGQHFDLHAGQRFNFTDHVAGGVDRFTLLGVDVTEQLNPNDPNAFVVGLTFGADNGSEFSVQINPLVVGVPEPGPAWLLLAGVPLLGLRARRGHGARSPE